MPAQRHRQLQAVDDIQRAGEHQHRGQRRLRPEREEPFPPEQPSLVSGESLAIGLRHVACIMLPAIML